MGNTDRLMREAAGQALLRRTLLVVNAASYVAWIGSIWLMHVGTIDPGALSLVQTIAWPVWLISLFGILAGMVYMRRRRDIAGLVDDERTVGLAATAFKTGYWVLLVAVAGVYAGSFFTTIDVRLVAPVLLALGVATPSVTYAALYRF